MNHDVVIATYDPHLNIKVLVSPNGEVWNEYDTLKSLGENASAQTITDAEVKWLQSFNGECYVNDSELGFYKIADYITEIQNFTVS